MDKFFKKELSDYSDDELLSLLRNSIGIEKQRITEIIEQLEKRGYSDQVRDVERILIKNNPIYSKFWNRLGAFLIDVLLLGVLGYILGLLFGSVFIQMGNQGILVGFIISLAYFGLGNSKLLNGHTIGKRFLKLQVVDANFKQLSIVHSILRTLVYTVPYFFIYYNVWIFSAFTTLFFIKIIIISVFTWVLLIHFALNRSTRQAIHDLLIGSYVISLEAYPRQDLKKSKSYPIYISTAIGIVFTCLTIYFNLYIVNSNGSFKEIMTLGKQIDDIEGVQGLSINKSTNASNLNNEPVSKTVSLVLTINIDNDLISDANQENFQEISLVKDVVKVVLNDYATHAGLNILLINIVHGYNIGIYKQSKSFGVLKTIDDWRQIK